MIDMIDGKYVIGKIAVTPVEGLVNITQPKTRAGNLAGNLKSVKNYE